MGSTSLVNASEKTVTDEPFEPKAKRVIHICLMGGMSHLTVSTATGSRQTTWQKLQYEERPATSSTESGSFGKTTGNSQRGESGMWVSDLFTSASVADDLTVIIQWCDSANLTSNISAEYRLSA